MTQFRTTVLVVGSGPAGTSAAITARRYGLAVALIAPTRSKSNVRVETLHPGIEPLLRQLDVWDMFDKALISSYTEVESQDAEGKRHREPLGEDEQGSWHGYHIDRTRFDETLINRAQEAGVDMIHNQTARRVLQRDGALIGVRTNMQTIEARYIIDATGRSNWLARQLNITLRQDSERLYASCSRVKSPDDRSTHHITSFSFEDNGWTWRAPLSEREVAVTKIRRHPEKAKGHYGADVTWTLNTNPSGHGYFCIGDAACRLDPSAGHGVLRAIMSGTMASHSIASIEHGQPGTSMYRNYSEWITRWYELDREEISARLAI